MVTCVQYELLRPSQVRERREQCPIVYIPVGSLEWHGVQNPLGTDGLKVHAIEPQRDAIHDGIQRACRGTGARGFGVTEGENWHGGASMKYSMDHAGAWETSAMLYAHGGQVDLEELRAQMEAAGRSDQDKLEMSEPEGIGGWNPLKYASADLGRQIVDFCAGRIASRAVEVLQGKVTPPEKADAAFMDNPGPTD